MLPRVEREEILADLAREHRGRRERHGALAARLWVWRQALASLPALVRRGWWRGWSGFETPSDRLQPGGAMFESLAIDVKFALRRLLRRRTYTALTVLTLALGVAGTAAVYGIARRLLFDPLPLRAEDEVVAFWFEGAWSEMKFLAVRPVMTGFHSVAAGRPTDAALRLGDGPARLLKGYSASAELFDVLGVRPALGTGFRRGDDRVGAEPVAVLSHSLWRELGGRPSIVGERIELSGERRTVVGVMPEGFWFPDPGVRVWLSNEMNPESDTGYLGLIARLPPGKRIEAMGPQLQAITRLLDERYEFVEDWDLTKDPELTPIRERLLGKVTPSLVALLVAMGVILLVACVNVAALMLGQLDTRGTEMAMRSALGAGRQRLLQQLAVESIVIGALAGMVGAALAVVGFPFLAGALPLGALAEAARLDWALFAAAMAVALVASTLIALAPGTAVAQGDLRGTLNRSRTGGIGGRGGRLEHGLVVGQVALVLLLTAGAALLIRSVDNRRAIDPGVDVEGVAVLDLQLPETIERERIPQLLRELVTTAGALPGVESAAATQRLPLRGSSDNWGIGIESQPDRPETTTAFRVVTPDYFRTMRIRLKSGRLLLDTDRDPERRGRRRRRQRGPRAQVLPRPRPARPAHRVHARTLGPHRRRRRRRGRGGPLRRAGAGALHGVRAGLLAAHRADAGAAHADGARSRVGPRPGAASHPGGRPRGGDRRADDDGERARARRRAGAAGDVAPLAPRRPGARPRRHRHLRRRLPLRDAAEARLEHPHRARHAAGDGVRQDRRARRRAHRRRARARPGRVPGVGEAARELPLRRRHGRPAGAPRRGGGAGGRGAARGVGAGATSEPRRPGGRVEGLMTMSKDAPLGTFEEQVMLAVLRTREEPYGMAVRREIEEVIGRDVTIGAVYATLDRLEAKGLVESARSAGTGDVARRVFAVTPRGARALAASREMRERLWRGVDLRRLLAESSR